MGKWLDSLDSSLKLLVLSSEGGRDLAFKIPASKIPPTPLFQMGESRRLVPP